MIKPAIATLGTILLTVRAVYSQRAPTRAEIDGAQLVLSRGLNSDKDAEHHILFLESYVEQSPW